MGNSSASKYTYKTTSDEIGQEFSEQAKNRYVVVTGGNVGLGYETCRVLSKHGAHVTLACRNPKLGEEAVAKLKEENPDADVELRILDLGSLASIQQFAADYRSSGRDLHNLIRNVGIMACPLSATTDGFETQFGVNHLGHFHLTNELVDVLKRSGTSTRPARVINLSSMGAYLFAPSTTGLRFDDLEAKSSYHVWERYGASKLANILFAKEFNRRMIEDQAPVIAVSLHPGVILSTELARHSYTMTHIVGGMGQFNSLSAVYKVIVEPMKTIPEGTATTLYCALSPDIVPGEYYANSQIETTYVHPKANDIEVAKTLWQVSERLINDAKAKVKATDATPINDSK
jgi:NAD(P)-dependent dehydrogenase (short-subunit alcohol dehydrogenase family)